MIAIHSKKHSVLLRSTALLLCLSLPAAVWAQQQQQPLPFAQPQPQAQAQPQPPKSTDNGYDLTLLYQGRDLYRQGNMQGALSTFQAFNAKHPNNLAVHFWLGLTYDKLGDGKTALAEYTSSLQLAQSVGMDSPELRIDMANLLSKQGYTKETLYDYQRSLVIDKRYALGYLGLAKCLLATDDYSGTIEALNSFERLGGKDIYVPLLRGLAQAGLGQSQDATGNLRVFLSQNNYGATAGSAQSTTPNRESIDLAQRILNEIEQNH